MNLVIDAGNSRVKYGYFKNDKLEKCFVSERFDLKSALLFETDHILLSSTRKVSKIFIEKLNKISPLLVFENTTPIPLKISYKTPQTLGRDRIAAAVAAHRMYPGENVLSIDAGTCITYDMVTGNGEYLGGGISPGIEMRFSAMHDYTGKLPLVTKRNFMRLMGTNTEECMQSGVFKGVLNEVDGVIDEYRNEKGIERVIICGGNTSFFAKRLKNHIFAAENLVLYGLNQILNYNAE